MKKSASLILLLLLTIVIFTQCKTGAEKGLKGQKLIITNVNVIPMNKEAVLSGKAVLVTDGRIEKIIDSSEAGAYKERQVIDGENKYLIPGMTDMHVHFLDPNEMTLFVANGITTVRNLGEFADPGLYPNSWGKDLYAKNNLQIKKKVEKGDLIGPRMFLAGRILDGNEPVYGDLHLTTPVTNQKEAKKMVLEDIRAGYDYIKVYFNLPAKTYRTIVETAGKHGKKVIGHVPFDIPLDEALQDMDTIEHLTGYYDYETVVTRIDHYGKLTKENNIWHCPTLNALKYMLPLEEPLMQEFAGLDEWKYLSPATRQKVLTAYDYAARHFAENPGTAGYFLEYFMYDIVVPLHENGVQFTVGTDHPFTIAGFSYHDELELMKKCGLSNYEVLKAATYNGADCLEQLDEFGTIEPGKAADLVLLDENPLEDIKNSRKISGVMLQGKWLDRETLDSMLKKAEDRYK